MQRSITVYQGISEGGLESDGYNQFRPHGSLGYKPPTPEPILVSGLTVGTDC